MRLIKEGFYYDFIGKRKFFYMLSLIVTLVALASIIYNKLTIGSLFVYGVDFTGGTIIQVNLKKPYRIDEVRALLDELKLKGVMVQSFGSSNEVLVRIPEVGIDPNSLQNMVIEKLRLRYNDAEVVRLENVGPKVGKELREKGLKAVILSCIAILIYIGWRFQLKYGIGAIIAVIHDVLVVAGIFALFKLDVDIQIVAALLIIAGYSVNDTIIIYDRIRENLAKKEGSLEKIINISISETLNRTVVTSLLVLICALSLLIFGNDIVRGFSLAFTVGTIVGTYSSIYVASAIALDIDRIIKKRRVK